MRRLAIARTVNDWSAQHPTARRIVVPRPDGAHDLYRAGVVDRSNSRTCTEDTALLHQFNRTQCAEAFEALVSRHAGWIGSLVRRHVKDRHLAEDVTQAVFIILARKAGKIPPGTMVSAWLFRVARFAARDAIKQESRRRRRHERVAENARATAAAADVIGPELDEALACLNESDRQAILLRFYEDKTMSEVGRAMGVTEEAAKKRVSRALKRMRDLLLRNGHAAAVPSIATLSSLLEGVTPASQSSATLFETIARIATGQTEATGRSLQMASSAQGAFASAHTSLLAAMAGSALVLMLTVSAFSPVMGEMIAPMSSAARSVFGWILPGNWMVSAAADSKPAQVPQPRPQAQQMWIGMSNRAALPLWPADSSQATLPLRSASGVDQPIAILSDSQDRLWYRRIDSHLVPLLTQSLAERLDYADLNPNALMADPQLLDIGLGYFHDVPGMDGSFWRPVDLPLDDSGVVVVPMYLESDLSEMNANGVLAPIAEVPEPAILSGLAIAAGLVLMRRRRR